ncbi:hypothetical protein PMAYCL1PPCAC_09619 [Pristionchus mayeri]|uniref:Uncharacterized protein n=1 Tax=Pristionchus mayeri TaxID=1317129 RepID=A0AAN5CE37_9BILA|nr:hypothetical protein PMAYCL1PPCAC_09619 [Pristionchus mayeri]
MEFFLTFPKRVFTICSCAKFTGVPSIMQLQRLIRQYWKATQSLYTLGESSPFVYFTNCGAPIYVLDTNTMELVTSIYLEDVKQIMYIAGVYNGEITVIDSEGNKLLNSRSNIQDGIRQFHSKFLWKIAMMHRGNSSQSNILYMRYIIIRQINQLLHRTIYNFLDS